MSFRKVRDAADAADCLSAATASGETCAAWARRNGVDPRSLNAWRMNLTRGRRARVRAPPRLVELVPTAPAPAAEPTRYRVHVGDLAVEVDERFDEGVLRRLLAVASSC
jgi:hypothetical protein